MTAIFISRNAAWRNPRLLAFFFVAATFFTPHPLLAQSPETSAPQTSSSDAAKKISPPPNDNSAATKSTPPKPHRVFTDDDFAPATPFPVPPGAYLRLKQLNRCGRTCFNEVKKQAIQFGYTTTYPRSTREEMDDRLASYIEDLQKDPKWQRLLLEMIAAHIDSCTMRQNAAQPQDQDPAPPHTPTRQEILDEENRSKNVRPPTVSNFNTAGSAVLAYRFSSRPDPLKASLMVHQYMDEVHRECAPPDADDPVDP